MLAANSLLAAAASLDVETTHTAAVLVAARVAGTPAVPPLANGILGGDRPVVPPLDECIV